MSTTVNTGWLKDNNGDKFAPKTLTSQVIDSNGVSVDQLLSNMSVEIDPTLTVKGVAADAKAVGDALINHEHSWNDLTDKPFYSEMVEMDATFDGDLTGKEYYNMEDGTILIKMSNTPLTVEQLIGSTVTIRHNIPDFGATGDTTVEFTITSNFIREQALSDSSGMVMVISEFDVPVILSVYGDISSAGIPLPEGTYYINLPMGEGVYFYTQSSSRLNGIQEVITMIDEKYIPNTIARDDELFRIIDVAELPTEGIDKSAIYRLAANAVMLRTGEVQTYNTVYCVEEFPEIGEETVSGKVFTYYNVKTGQTAEYEGEWTYPVYEIVRNRSDVPQTGRCILVDTRLYVYEHGWIPISQTRGVGIDSVIFNDSYNIASANYSFAEGWSTTASGKSSHAEGYSTTASGDYSHAEGRKTTASDMCSHAEGYDTTASGYSSHAEGYITTASGDYSHAEGHVTTASGESSHAEGWCTVASSKRQHVQGLFNIEDTEEKYAHIVGNGGARNPSNAHTLDWDGNAWFAGDVYIGGTGQDDEDAKKLATEEYVNTQIANIPTSGGSGANAIIDVASLPADNINKNSWYRLVTGSLVFNQYIQETYTVHCVEVLPEVGLPATNVDQSQGNIYYVVSTGEAYGYVDDILSAGMGVPAGWYDDVTLLGALGYEAKGIITDIDDDPCDDSFRILLKYDFYMYQDGWCKVPFGYEKAPKIDITWDGVIGDKFALDLSALGYSGFYFVKISDDVFNANQLIGATYTQSQGYTHTISDESIDYTTYTGALNVDGGIIIVYSADDTNAALGLPAGYVTNGTYFVLDADRNNYTNRIVSSSKTIKIDSKYLDVDLDMSAVETLIANAIGGAIGGSY